MSKAESFKSSKEESNIDSSDKTGEEYIDLSGDGGVLKKIIAPGFGDLSPQEGNDVKIAYTGRFTSGQIFEWKEDQDAIIFRLGQNEVCPGIERAIVTMKKREVAEIKLQPKYGYGEEGQPPTISGNTPLIYEIRLLDWSNEIDISDSQDGGIIKRLVTSGDGWEKPIEDISIRVHIVGSTDDGEEFENKELSFISNEESTKENGILVSLFKGILTMRKNEVSIFNIKSKYAYGKEGNDERHIMPNENLVFQVKLIDFEQEDKEYKKLKSHDKLVLAIAKKDYGNNLYSNYLLERAVRKYSIALKILNSIYITDTEEDKQTVTKLRVSCYLNLAACYLKMDKEKEAISECSNALKISPDNVKALFRRGRARIEIKDWENALNDLNKALEIDPTNNEIMNEITRLEAKKIEQDKKDKSIFGGLFKRGHLYEDKSVANLPFWSRFTSTILSPGVTQEQVTVMNYVFIALFITILISLIFAKFSIHMLILLAIALLLCISLNWFISNALPDDKKDAKEEKTE